MDIFLREELPEKLADLSLKDYLEVRHAWAMGLALKCDPSDAKNIDNIQMLTAILTLDDISQREFKRPLTAWARGSDRVFLNQWVAIDGDIAQIEACNQMEGTVQTWHPRGDRHEGHAIGDVVRLRGVKEFCEGGDLFSVTMPGSFNWSDLDRIDFFAPPEKYRDSHLVWPVELEDITPQHIIDRLI